MNKAPLSLGGGKSMEIEQGLDEAKEVRRVRGDGIEVDSDLVDVEEGDDAAAVLGVETGAVTEVVVSEYF